MSRNIVKNIVDASSLRDIQDASVFEEYTLPKIYLKNYYCISCAVHTRVVRGREKEERKNRAPPPRFRAAKSDDKQKAGGK